MISWFVFGLVGQSIARNRGVPDLTGFSLGAFLGPIGLIIVALLKPDESIKRNQGRYDGVRDVSKDRYRLWLAEKYGVKHNVVLDRYVTKGEPFQTLDMALNYLSRVEEAEVEEREAASMRAAAIRHKTVKIIGLLAIPAVLIVGALIFTQRREQQKIEYQEQQRAERQRSEDLSGLAKQAEELSDLSRQAQEAAAEAESAPSEEGNLPTSFTPLGAPGRIELLQCHMDECTWSQIQNITTMRSDTQRTLLKVSSRDGSSSHNPEDDPEYPESYNSEVKIDWQGTNEQSYVLCSHERPTIASEGSEGWFTDTLSLRDISGFQVAATNTYMLACHGLRPRTWGDEQVRSFGYKQIEPQQATKPSLQAALSTLW
jgi:hypothetical protein